MPGSPRPVGDTVLRAFAPSDVSVVAEAARDGYVRLLTGLEPDAADGAAGSAVAYVARQPLRQERGLGYSFAIADRATGACVGQIGLWLRGSAPDGATGYREESHGRAAIGYWVVPSRRRLGHASRALEAIAAWALMLPEVHRLELFVEPWNEGSWRAAERAGFAREGLLRSWQAIGDQRRDMLVYSRLRPEVA